MSELTKLPTPVPSVVLLFEIVGPVELPQQTPLAVTVAPPSTVMFPPAVAVVVVMDPALVVVKVGTTGGSTGGGHPVKTSDNKESTKRDLIHWRFVFFMT